MATNVYTAYFSPTGTTKRIATEVAGALADARGSHLRTIDFTPAGQRPADVVCHGQDVLVFGFPVYAGRVPEVLLDKIARFHGEGTPVVIVGVYGNRNYDDALLEARDLLENQGFEAMAVGAFIAEHSMTSKVATGRPDANDLVVAARFGREAAAKLAGGKREPLHVKGSFPYKDRPAPADIRPRTTDDCTACGICVERCPMGVIDADDPTSVEAGCIRCNACVKSCPEQAKFFDSEMINKVVALLESSFTEPKQPELFL